MAAVEADALATRPAAPDAPAARRAKPSDASEAASPALAAPAAPRRARPTAKAALDRRKSAADRSDADASFRRLLVGLCVCMAFVLLIALTAARTPT